MAEDLTPKDPSAIENIDDMLHNSIQDQESELINILDNTAITFEGDSVNNKENDDYTYVYSGNAMTSEELFRFSAKEDVNLVLVAGPFASGKTTLVSMLYYLFLEGHSKTLQFSGSVTIKGFKERSSRTLYSSGEPEPIVERTRRTDKSWYLHLAVKNKDGEKHNLIFTDISGEVFSESFLLEEIAELFFDSKNVILVVDGEDLCDDFKRENAFLETIIELKQLLRCKIITNETNLQIICTKKDKLDDCENRESVIQFISSKQKILLEQYGSKVLSMEFEYLSALNMQKEDREQLESIMLKCMDNRKREISTDLFTEEHDLLRWFDKYRVRG